MNLRRRDVLVGLAAFVAGCQSGLTPAPAPEAAWPPIGAVPPPPNAPPYLAGAPPRPTSTGDPVLDSWLRHVVNEAGDAWRPYLLKAFAGLRANPVLVTEYDGHAAATPADLIADAVAAPRVAAGRTAVARLRPAGERRAPLPVIAAIWGMASDYGTRLPGHDMIEVLAHLGAHRGAQWAGSQILHAVAVHALSGLPPATLRAYPDGRIGQVAWLPESYGAWAADGDNDGVRNIWTSEPDVWASIARRLERWEPGPLLAEVKPPEMPDQRATWRGTDVTRADGRPWSVPEATAAGRLLSPAGSDGPVFLAFRNFDVLSEALDIAGADPARREAHAVAVALLADQIDVPEPLFRPR